MIPRRTADPSFASLVGVTARSRASFPSLVLGAGPPAVRFLVPSSWFLPSHVLRSTFHVPPRSHSRGRYFAGIGVVGRSDSQKIVSTYQRVPSLKSWMLLMPRMKGVASVAARRLS